MYIIGVCVCVGGCVFVLSIGCNSFIPLYRLTTVWGRYVGVAPCNWKGDHTADGSGSRGESYHESWRASCYCIL